VWLWPTRVHVFVDLVGGVALLVLILVGVMPWWTLAILVAIALVARTFWRWRDGVASRDS
jgi:hypothetical protein